MFPLRDVSFYVIVCTLFCYPLQFFEQRQPSRQSGSHSPLPGNTLSSSPFSPSSQAEQQGKSQNNNTEDYSLHPMVRELTSRALT